MKADIGGNDEMDLFGDDEVELDSDELEQVITDAVDEETTAVEQVKSSQNKNLALGGLDLDFSSLGSLPGVVVGDIGLTVSRVPVERAKFTKDSRALINFVTSKVIAIKVHYRPGIGSYLCFNGECCEYDGLARVKYLFPVNIYDTNKKGKPISPEMSYRVLAVGADQYEDLMAIQELNGDITQMDILVSCKDEQYQKLSFQTAGSARILNNDSWKKQRAESAEFWKNNYKHIIKSSARVITKAELMKDVNESVGVTMSDEMDFDKVFGDSED